MKDRRREDRRIGKLINDIEVLKTQLALNTEMTKKINEILTSLKFVTAIAKWFAIVFTAIGLGLHVGNDIKDLIKK